MNTKIYFIVVFLVLLNSSLYSQKLNWAYLFESNNNVEKYITEISQEKNGDFSILGNIYDSTNIEFKNPKKMIGISKDYRCFHFIGNYDNSKSLKWIKRMERKSNCYKYTSFNINGNREKIVALILNDTVKLTDDSLKLSPKQKNCKNLVLLKYNSFGKLLWYREYDGISIDYFNSRLHVDNKNNILLNCAFSDSIHIEKLNDIEEKTYYAEGRNDIFLLKLSTDGEIQWVQQIKSFNNNTNIKNLITDSINNILIVGNYKDSMQYDIQKRFDNYHSNFIIKLNENGKFIWHRELLNYDIQSEFSNIVCDKKNNIYITSEYCQKNDIYFDSSFLVPKNISIASGQTTLVFKLDSNGHYKNHIKIESNKNCALFSTKMDLNNSWLYVIGHYYGDSLTINSTNDSLKLYNPVKDVCPYLSIFDFELNLKSLLSFKSSDITSYNSEKLIYDLSIYDTNIYIVGLNKGEEDYDFSKKQYVLKSRVNYGSPFIAKYSTTLLDKDSIDNGITEISSRINFIEEKKEIYPNPFSNYIIINKDIKESILNVSLIDLQGRIVLETKNIKSLNYTLNVGDEIIKGIYILSLKSNNSTKYIRVIKE